MDGVDFGGAQRGHSHPKKKKKNERDMKRVTQQLRQAAHGSEGLP